MWWQILLMVLSVLFIVKGIYSTIAKLIPIILNKEGKCNIAVEEILLTIGISYLIWFCN